MLGAFFFFSRLRCTAVDAKCGLCSIAAFSREVSCQEHLGMQSDGDGDDDNDDDELCTPGITSSYYDNHDYASPASQRHT